MTLQREPLSDFQQPIQATEFRKIMHQVTDFICDYYESQVEKLPVLSQCEQGDIINALPLHAPNQGEDWQRVWSDFLKILLPGVTHWQSPNFFGYFPASASYAGILGEVLSATLNIVGFSWIGSPSATELEMVVMDWLARLLSLPKKFLCGNGGGVGGGVIKGTASEAILVTIVAARTRKSVNMEDTSKLVMYSSDQAHSAFQKGCQIAGIKHVRRLTTKKENEWALSAIALEKAIKEDISNGLIPCMLQINVGTTSTCAVDSIEQLVQVCKKYDMWSHVDAAYAGSAAICPDIRREYFQGLEDVDSFNFNPHKWLFVNFACSALWVGDSRSLIKALSITPEYLRAKGNNMDLRDWSIPLSRPFRSLKLWFVLRLFGVEKLQQKIQRDIALAYWFASQIQQDPLFELVVPQRFGLVCFRVRDQSNQFNEQLLNKLNESGKVFMVHTIVGGSYIIRFALGGTFTQFRHVQAAWELIKQTTRMMLTSKEVNGVVLN